jgi:hypothetical protein
LIFEAVAGMEAFANWKKHGDVMHRRKILLVKWLYVQGFFNDNIFPPIERFIPPHMADDMEDNE